MRRSDRRTERPNHDLCSFSANSPEGVAQAGPQIRSVRAQPRPRCAHLRREGRLAKSVNALRPVSGDETVPKKTVGGSLQTRPLAQEDACLALAGDQVLEFLDDLVAAIEQRVDLPALHPVANLALQRCLVYLLK